VFRSKLRNYQFDGISYVILEYQFFDPRANALGHHKEITMSLITGSPKMLDCVNEPQELKAH